MPIVYLDRDLLKVFDDTYGVTITTVLVKPKSRGYVALRSADPGRHAAGARRTCSATPTTWR